MSAPGWYPDPGGQAGMFRYWDGSAWSAALSSTPHAARPTSVGPGGPGTDSTGSTTPDPEAAAGRGSKAWLIAAGAVVVALVVVVAFIVRGVSSMDEPRAGEGPGGASTRPVCPPRDLQTPDAAATRDGRVYGGRLSYPQLPAPWTEPRQETRVPFGRNAWTQTIHVENYPSGSGESAWVASVLVAELNAGDGFFTAEDGSEIVVTCIVGAFYGDAKVTRHDRVNRATTVDGHAAWLVETDLAFRIPGLQTDRELAIVLIVETGTSGASVYYASIPNTAPQWEAPARQAMAELAVER